MRLSRGISQRETGRRCDISEAAVGHYENGRMDVSSERLRQFLTLYGYALAEFDDYVNGKPLPVISVKDECLRLLNALDEQKLRAIHAVLVSFAG